LFKRFVVASAAPIDFAQVLLSVPSPSFKWGIVGGGWAVFGGEADYAAFVGEEVSCAAFSELEWAGGDGVGIAAELLSC
jgi:hypothetical protein